MKFIPKLFNTEMVIALLNGTKNQTRRIKGLEKLTNYYFQSLVHHATGTFTFVENGNYNPTEADVVLVNPPANVGDVLWVRENFYAAENFNNWSIKQLFECKTSIYYTSDRRNNAIEKPLHPGKNRPSIHMPKKACRLFLEVTEVTVERLNDISESDAINEGIEDMLLNVDTTATAYRNYLATYKDLQKDHWSHVANNAVESYMSLWQKINGINSWNENPWVWVIKFKKIDKPNNFI